MPHQKSFFDQEALAIQARELLARLGGSLGKTVESFNAAVASYEGRVLPTARKFKALGAGSKKEIEELPPIDKAVRNPAEIIKG